MRLVGEDGGPVPDGEIGELQVSGPTSAAYYWNNRDKTRDTFLGRWTRSGDKYMRSADGYYTYCGRTDDMLIYKGMNVFPTSIRDLVAEAFAGEVEPLVRIWKDNREQVRFDAPIPLEVEAAPGLPAGRHAALAQAIEARVRTQLQVRVAVTVVAPGSLPRSAYKNSLVAVKESPP